MDFLGLQFELHFRLLLWSTMALSGVVGLLIAYASLVQVQADHHNDQRIASFRRWEASVPRFIFGQGPPPERLLAMGELERHHFLMFLQRLQVSLGGPDAARLTELYFLANLDRGVEQRLANRRPRVRALAAMEVWGFGLWRLLPQVLPLLDDPHPYVAFSAARALARSRNLEVAPALLHWVLGQDHFQRERVMVTLEQFGAELLPWMQDFLLPPSMDPDGWTLYALLAGSHRHADSLHILLGLLDSEVLDLKCSAIKSLQSLGDPLAFAKVAELSEDAQEAVRLRATVALAPLGGKAALPLLKARLTDRVFEIRRHAGLGLASLGEEGAGVLAEVASDVEADPYARDMAAERLEWLQQGRQS